MNTVNLKSAIIRLGASGLLSIFSLSTQADLIAFWDFNDEPVNDPLVNTPFTFSPNAGSQSAAELSMVLADTGSANTFGVRSEGTVLNDLVNEPTEAGNSFSFSRGFRSRDATASISFDAGSISLPIEMSFAINRIATEAVDEYQASYSIDGGDNFTNLGGGRPHHTGHMGNPYPEFRNGTERQQ